MRTSAKLSALALTVVLGTGLSSRGQGDRWVQLGQTRPTPISTTAFMPGSTTKGAFCNLQFRSEGPGLTLLHLSIHFGNGQTYQIGQPITISENSISSPIHLPGRRRSIRNVEFIYERPLLGTLPTLTLYGDATITADPCPS